MINYDYISINRILLQQRDNYSPFTMDYFDQFNQNFIGMNCYTYTLSHIIHTFGMDNEIVHNNSYTIIDAINRSYHKIHTTTKKHHFILWLPILTTNKFIDI